jgi:hypothetical protein
VLSPFTQQHCYASLYKAYTLLGFEPGSSASQENATTTAPRRQGDNVHINIFFDFRFQSGLHPSALLTASGLLLTMATSVATAVYCCCILLLTMATSVATALALLYVCTYVGYCVLQSRNIQFKICSKHHVGVKKLQLCLSA